MDAPWRRDWQPELDRRGGMRRSEYRTRRLGFCVECTFRADALASEFRASRLQQIRMHVIRRQVLDIVLLAELSQGNRVVTPFAFRRARAADSVRHETRVL